MAINPNYEEWQRKDCRTCRYNMPDSAGSVGCRAPNPKRSFGEGGKCPNWKLYLKTFEIWREKLYMVSGTSQYNKSKTKRTPGE